MICTGNTTKSLLKIKIGSYYKMPKLEELYYWCFKTYVKNMHEAKYDVKNLINILVNNCNLFTNIFDDN